MYIRSVRFTFFEPAAEEVVVGEDTWDTGDELRTGYEISKSLC
jgi:hypothetical protein